MPEFAEPNLDEVVETGLNAVVTSTLAAPGLSGTGRWRIKTLLAAVSGGSAVLTVTSGGNALLSLPVTPGAPLLGWQTDIECLAANDAIVASLSAAGAGNTGYVFIAGEVT